VNCPAFPNGKEPEAFAREAKYFVEFHVLGREIEVALFAHDRFTLIGSMSYAGRNVGEELLKSGLGKLNPLAASLPKSVLGPLQAAENEAKEKRLRVWAGWVAQERVEPVVAISNQFTGKVAQIISTTSLVVVDPSGKKRTIYLSSIKAPSPGNPRDTYEAAGSKVPLEKLEELRADRAWANQGKELLRQKLISKKVNVRLDYVREAMKEGEQPRPHCSVFIDNLNVAEMLIERGLASVLSHRADEPRAGDYSRLLSVETEAKKKHKGIFGPRDKAPVARVNDLSVEPNSQRARQFLPFLQRAGTMRCVVEHVFNAGRYKVFIPKESVVVFFSLGQVRPPEKDDPLFDRSAEWVRDRILQHEVDVQVEATDKTGGFLGRLSYARTNIALELLDEGFVSLFGPGSAIKEDYRAAERAAKNAHLGIWKNWDPEEEERKKQQREKEQLERFAPREESCTVSLTEILSGYHFYMQIETAEVQALLELKDAMQHVVGPQIIPNVGDLVSAQFTADDQWYRAQVKSINQGIYSVFYVDYGNTDELDLSRIRGLEEQFCALPPQAHETYLAFVETPSLDEEFGQAAAFLLRDLAMGKPVPANIEYRDGKKLFVSLGNEQRKDLVNAAILRAGLGRISPGLTAHGNPYIVALQEEEIQARREHLNLWQHGDYYAEDEDEY
jgi:staphylococcal nuclease domain-containing protein 1